jgi:hypothetical protein
MYDDAGKQVRGSSQRWLQQQQQSRQKQQQ